MSGSGAPKRDTPDNEDFEGAPDQSDQQGEDAPHKGSDPGKKQQGEQQRKQDEGEGKE
jgi:hypothetical protein